jgi:plasmid stabilization system protein ParE
MKVILADKAKGDLFRIYSYIEQRSRRRPKRYSPGSTGNSISSPGSPSSGANGPASRLRSAVVGTHLILYTVQDDNIIIVRVIDGRMDIAEELRR